MCCVRVCAVAKRQNSIREWKRAAGSSYSDDIRLMIPVSDIILSNTLPFSIIYGLWYLSANVPSLHLNGVSAAFAYIICIHCLTTKKMSSQRESLSVGSIVKMRDDGEHSTVIVLKQQHRVCVHIIKIFCLILVVSSCNNRCHKSMTRAQLFTNKDIQDSSILVCLMKTVYDTRRALACAHGSYCFESSNFIGVTNRRIEKVGLVNYSINGQRLQQIWHIYYKYYYVLRYIWYDRFDINCRNKKRWIHRCVSKERTSYRVG